MPSQDDRILSASPKDPEAEREYQARQAAALPAVQATPLEVLERYRRCRDWQLFRKEYLFKLVHDLSPRRVLDFGCGDGEISVELAAIGCEVVGIDISPDMIRRAEQRAILDGFSSVCRFVCDDGGEASLPVSSFDAVIANAVLHHVDMETCLSKIERVLKPGGYLICAEPVSYSPFLQAIRNRTAVEKDISENERQLGKADLRLIAARFDIVQSRHFHLLYRLERLPQFWRFRRRLAQFDRFLLMLPGMAHFAGVVVLSARKRDGDGA
jgi:ubiquinone/menaquinone biosynthesis C-methylase UbiE